MLTKLGLKYGHDSPKCSHGVTWTQLAFESCVNIESTSTPSAQDHGVESVCVIMATSEGLYSSTRRAYYTHIYYTAAAWQAGS